MDYKPKEDLSIKDEFSKQEKSNSQNLVKTEGIDQTETD